MGCSVSGDSLQYRLKESVLAYWASDTTVYLFTDATLHSVLCPHRFYFCVMTNKPSTVAIAKICLLVGL